MMTTAKITHCNIFVDGVRIMLKI